uniref:Putative ovule protein n=1 Tax=Solanum chacoense TaxID=4108 RepID=A0A0V0GTK1_SOLCH
MGLFPFGMVHICTKMAAPIVKGATTTMQDGLYGYLPCLGSMFSTEITSNIATMVTVPFLMSCYHQYDVYKGFTGRLQIASGQQCI